MSPDQSPAPTAPQRSGPPPGAATLCLGEAVVDLICERPLDDLALADAFVPHFGGSVANVAVIAARHGARVALAGGAGDDAWGRWLRDRLEREGVGVSLFGLVPGSPTPLALVAVNRAGEPSYQIYGETIATVVEAVSGDLEEAMRDAAAVYISSNTLVGAEEREVTMRARELALGLGRPVVFDPNLRLHRWRSRAEAAAAANACVPGALLVRANADEVTLMTGEDDLERAATALLKAGARMVVITLGPDGAILRGEMRLDVPGRPAAVLSTIGAGDVLTGVLLARLATSGFYPPALAASLPEAVVQSSLACERWGALE
ncbi:MAG TPA: PfkB family carbohydrate kinase [Solirubrobacteraceae bacterium]|nr:PfkB family carbohydrate kinase [Solirubrobacteraceae bacterium]